MRSSAVLSQSGQANDPEDDLMRTAISLCESGRFEYVSATCCRLRIEYTVVGDKEWWHLDLTAYRLPETGLTGQCLLSDDRRLAIATVLALDAYLCGAGHEKATHRIIANMACTIAKFWEWGRLNGVYRPEDWTEAHFRQLEMQLARGKWSLALQSKERVIALLKTRPQPNLIARIERRCSLRKGLSVLLGTNQGSQELSCARGRVHRYAQKTEPATGWEMDVEPKTPTVTWLTQAFWAANLFARLPSPFSFVVTPFPDPMARAKKLAKEAARTPTMSVEQAVGLLTHSLKYVYERAEIIVDLVRELGRIALAIRASKPTSTTQKNKLRDRLWGQSPVRAQAENLLGKKLSLLIRATRPMISVPELVDNLMTAGVILLAGMNARRKNEILHKKFGLHRDAICVVNKELGVYEATFYIEKTIKSYAPFFVNQSSYDAFVSLQRLERAQLDVECQITGVERTAEKMEHSLFWSRRYSFSADAYSARTWFDFSLQRRGAAVGFVTEALGPEFKLSGRGAHIFRRFYAIIFFYRFEHGGLLALRYQLAHFNCETARQYVTDAMIQAVEARIPIELRRAPDDVRSALTSEWREVELELQKVGSEKLEARIFDLLEGGQASGGFPRLLERLHRRMMVDIDYAEMDAGRRARHLLRRLEARGHFIRPLPHADCTAGSSSARGAKCAKSKGLGLAPENAAPIVCAQCPYSWSTAGHLQGQRMDLETLDREIAGSVPGTLIAKRRMAERANLQRAIWLHEQRLKSES